MISSPPATARIRASAGLAAWIWVLLILCCIGGNHAPHLFCCAQTAGDTTCAGNMVKSKTCGADSNIHTLLCCPGHVCEGRFCVAYNNMETDGGGGGVNHTSLLLEETRAEEEERQGREEEAKVLRPREREALVKLYGVTGGGNWIRPGGWLDFDVDHCRWEGVTCNEYDIVTELKLARNNMTGKLFDLPAALTYLEHIDMHANQLEATLPSDFRVDHPSLHFIDLSKNKLTGNLSDKSSITEHLEYLDLSGNEIGGRFEPKFDMMELCPPPPPLPPCPSNVTVLNVTTWPPNYAHCKPPCPSNVTVLNVTTWPPNYAHCNETLANLTAPIVNNTTNATEPQIPEPPCGPNLTHIDLGDNVFEFVNVTYFTSLRHLDLSKNGALNQTLSETGISSLMFLESLILSESRLLTGDLRVGHMAYLKNLDLNGMALSGDIERTGIMNITTLSSIDLSKGNEFKGLFDFCDMLQLKSLKLAGQNVLSGNLTGCKSIGTMEYFDVSDNEFSGRFEPMGSAITLQFVNLHRNAFTGTLPAFELMQDITYMHLGENLFTGTLPELAMPALKYLNISYNTLTGDIPSTISQLSVLDTLDLSNQFQTEYDASTGLRVTRGLTGQMPNEIGQVGFLQNLFLQSNLLTGTIPESLARLTYLNSINVEDNFIGGQIPSSINILEQLGNVMLARNRLTGTIPELGGSAETVRTVTMKGNLELQSPAPFKLCDLDDLDLRDDSAYCPSDRSALAIFYSNTLGTEWLDNTNWLETDHCEWHGVTCSEDKSRVLKLELVANGVAGQIPEALFDITSLQHLDLNDNDLRGEIPEAIANAKDLQYLRLSYNRFTALPDSISNLTKLALVHLHANRMEGDASAINLMKKEDIPDELLETLPDHRFISDCGDPQDVSDAFVCTGCDMCCNSLEECNTPNRQQFSAWQSTAILLASVFAALCVGWAIARCLTAKRILSEPSYSALEAAGDDSVYFYFLSDSKWAWLVTIATLFIQIAIFGLFLSAASFDNDDGDFVYSWRCPLNTPECNDERAVGPYGWIMWVFLVTAALLDDIINGIKLLLLSSTRGSTKCFISGMSLFVITVLAVYSSFFYNKAIAMTNTELIVNAVILLFINDFDEQVCSVVGIVNGKWLKQITEEAGDFSEKMCHEHIRASMMTNFDRDDDSTGNLKISSVYDAGTSGINALSNVNVGSQEEIMMLLQTMQNRIDVLERNARPDPYGPTKTAAHGDTNDADAAGDGHGDAQEDDVVFGTSSGMARGPTTSSHWCSESMAALSAPYILASLRLNFPANKIIKLNQPREPEILKQLCGEKIAVMQKTPQKKYKSNPWGADWNDIKSVLRTDTHCKHQTEVVISTLSY